jgi:hypothetical protein
MVPPITGHAATSVFFSPRAGPPAVVPLGRLWANTEAAVLNTAKLAKMRANGKFDLMISPEVVEVQHFSRQSAIPSPILAGFS